MFSSILLFLFSFRNHHRDLKDSYDRLNRIASKGPKNQDFVEPKVQGLWRIAVESNFSADELASLKVNYDKSLYFANMKLKLKCYVKPIILC